MVLTTKTDEALRNRLMPVASEMVSFRSSYIVVMRLDVPRLVRVVVGRR